MNFKRSSSIVIAALAFGIALVACDSDSSSGPQNDPASSNAYDRVSVGPTSYGEIILVSSSSATPKDVVLSSSEKSSSSETSVSSSSSAAVSNVEYGTLADSRDGKSYKTVKIGSLTWMAENLNYDNSATATGSIDSSFCYDGIPANCEKYGRLYQEYAATAVCPEGWRLPTADDWRDLTTTAKSEFGDNNGSLRAVGEWENTIFGDNVTATNASGFSALPAGYRAKTGECDGEGTKAYFWGEDNMNHYAWILSNQYDMEKESMQRGYYAYAVRCVKE
ncbi:MULTISPECIES: FISUMP domain-containing protein [unclassified Fibrobacter]|uniref:FISUMP domain-containing protein n=1 Tax=unclassified Fibrobacter TaxID=2634177 RepID=UPI0025C06D19|nr:MULTISPECIES: FISUMP domain-containing protein [unclassified Fibrobacter]